VGGAQTVVIHKANYLRFTAPQSGTYRLDTCQAQGFDSIVAWLSSCGDPDSVRGLNDDGCGVTGGSSRLEFTTLGGQAHLFGLGTWSAVEPLPPASPLRITFIAPAANPADVDGDGRVDGVDLALLLGNWMGSGAGDIDGSGTVNGSDLAVLLNSWG
jgi:hypothetical protein